MPSTSDPCDGAFVALLSDGRTAAAIAVDVRVDPGWLVASDSDGHERARWRLADLRLVDRPRGDLPGRVAPAAGRPERLSFRDPALLACLDRSVPQLERGAYADHRLRRIALIAGLGALASVAALVFVVIPLLADRIAAILPREFQVRLGQATADGLAAALQPNPAKRFCRGAAGQAVLERLATRLAPGETLDPPPHLVVVRADLVNAFSLPGSRIVIPEGMLRKLGDGDELAGILAHEIGHAIHRHPMAVAVRRATTGILVGLLVGEVVGVSATAVVAATLLGAAYTREAEAEADASALDLLRAAGIDSGGFARSLDGFAALEKAADAGWVVAQFRTHPASAERAALVRARGARGGPAMTAEEWTAIRAICA